MSEEYNDELEIDWMGALARLCKSWRFILIVSVIFGALGIVAALMQPRKYNVKMTLAPEVQTSTSTSLSSISSILGIGSTSAAAGTDALNITLFPEICKSTPFLTELFPVQLPRQAQGAGQRPAEHHIHRPGRHPLFPRLERLTNRPLNIKHER